MILPFHLCLQKGCTSPLPVFCYLRINSKLSPSVSHNIITKELQKSFQQNLPSFHAHILSLDSLQICFTLMLTYSLLSLIASLLFPLRGSIMHCSNSNTRCVYIPATVPLAGLEPFQSFREPFVELARVEKPQLHTINLIEPVSARAVDRSHIDDSATDSVSRICILRPFCTPARILSVGV